MIEWWISIHILHNKVNLRLYREHCGTRLSKGNDSSIKLLSKVLVTLIRTKIAFRVFGIEGNSYNVSSYFEFVKDRSSFMVE